MIDSVTFINQDLLYNMREYNRGLASGILGIGLFDFTLINK